MSKKNSAKKHKKNRQERLAARAASGTVVTKTANRDKIEPIDFYGFPASVFADDLRRTGWATLVILVILGLVVAGNKLMS